MKITRRELRRLIKETIYVNPKGDAYDTTNDPDQPEIIDYLNQRTKRGFLASQSNEKLRRFAPDIEDLDNLSDDQISDMEHGILLADILGDQGEFKPFKFTEDEVDLRKFSQDEVTKANNALKGMPWDREPYKDNTALQKGKIDFERRFEKVERELTLKLKKILEVNPVPDYKYVIKALRNTTSLTDLINDVAKQEGWDSLIAQRATGLPGKVSHHNGVYYRNRYY